MNKPDSPLARPSAAAAACLAAALLASAALPTQAQGRPPAQDPEAIATVAAAYLREQLSALPGTPSIQVDPPRADNLTVCDDLVPFAAANMRPRSRMTVGIRCNAPHTWTTYVQAAISVPGQYYVAARTIAAGQTITPADVALRDGDLVALPAGFITDPALLGGMAAAYRISAGQALKAASLRDTRSVVRGQTVRINARGKGFMVSSEGQALDNAPPGAMVQVKTASGQVVSGIVRAANLVEVQL